MERLCSGCAEFEACESYSSRNVSEQKEIQARCSAENTELEMITGAMCVIRTQLRDSLG